MSKTYAKINRNKLDSKYQEVYDEFVQETDNFKNEDALLVYEDELEEFYKKVESTFPDALKEETIEKPEKKKVINWRTEVKDLQKKRGLSYEDALELYQKRKDAIEARKEGFEKMIEKLVESGLYSTSELSTAGIDPRTYKPTSKDKRDRDLKKDSKQDAVTDGEEIATTGRRFKRRSPSFGKAGGAKRPYYYEYRMNRRDKDEKVMLALGGTLPLHAIAMYAEEEFLDKRGYEIDGEYVFEHNNEIIEVVQGSKGKSIGLTYFIDGNSDVLDTISKDLLEKISEAFDDGEKVHLYTNAKVSKETPKNITVHKITKFAKGGEVPNASGMFHLPLELVVYVPSTQDVDKVVTVDEMNKRIEEVKTYLAELFGGYTSSEKLGGYMATSKKLVNEQIVQVVSFATKEAYEENKNDLVKKISEWAKEWGQEAIGLEFEGDLYYVPQQFAEGGDIKGYKPSNSDKIESSYKRRKPIVKKMVRTHMNSEVFSFGSGGMAMDIPMREWLELNPDTSSIESLRVYDTFHDDYGNITDLSNVDSDTKSVDVQVHSRKKIKSNINDLIVLNKVMYAKGGAVSNDEKLHKEIISTIALKTGVRESAISSFADSNNLSTNELSKIATGLGTKKLSASDVSTAIVGNKDNEYSKKVISFAKSNKSLETKVLNTPKGVVKKLMSVHLLLLRKMGLHERDVIASKELQREYASLMLVESIKSGAKPNSLTESDFNTLKSTGYSLLIQFLLFNGFFNEKTTIEYQLEFKKASAKYSDGLVTPSSITPPKTHSKYIVKNEILNIEVLNDDYQILRYDSSAILNGVNLFEKGGSILEKKADYYTVAEILIVRDKNGNAVKHKNGYWILKSAKPINIAPTDSAVRSFYSKYKSSVSPSNLDTWKDKLLKDKYLLKGLLTGSKSPDLVEKGYSKIEAIEWICTSIQALTNVIKETPETEKTYQLGDKYSSDFDYDGMLEYGEKITSKTSVNDLELYRVSLEDVNYHILARLIGKLIESKEAKKEVLQKLNAFKKALKDELSEDVQEFRYGGALSDGDEITFIALDGEPRKGTIVSRIDKDFEVSTSKGVSLVGRDDILSKSEPKQRSKFLGFFEKGGEVGENDKNKYFSIHNIQALEDKAVQSIVVANIENTPEKRKLAREYYPEDSYYFQYHNHKIDMRVMYEKGGNLVDLSKFQSATDKAKKEIEFLIKQGYNIESYSTEERDIVFGEDTNYIIATQGSKRPENTKIEFAIAYLWEDENSGELVIDKELIDWLEDGFLNHKLTVYTNAGVDLRSNKKGKNKNITFKKLPVTYAKGGSVGSSKTEKLKNPIPLKTRNKIIKLSKQVYEDWTWLDENEFDYDIPRKERENVRKRYDKNEEELRDATGKYHPDDLLHFIDSEYLQNMMDDDAYGDSDIPRLVNEDDYHKYSKGGSVGSKNNGIRDDEGVLIGILGTPVRYKDELYEITSKGTEVGITRSGEGAWGSSQIYIPAWKIEKGELTQNNEEVWIPTYTQYYESEWFKSQLK